MTVSIAGIRKTVNKAFANFVEFEESFTLVGKSNSTFDIATGVVTSIADNVGFTGILYGHNEQSNITAGGTQSGQNATSAFKLITKHSYFDGHVISTNSTISRVKDNTNFKIMGFSIDPSQSIVTYEIIRITSNG